MKWLLITLVSLLLLAGCATKKFDNEAYERQNKAAEKSLDSL